MTNILIVEDDDHKYSELVDLLDLLGYVRVEVSRADSVSTAIALVNKIDFDKVILDMSIPSHPRQRGTGAALNLAIGGLEVLFEMDLLGRDGRCVILTQFAEIEIEQILVPLPLSTDAIREKFQCAVLDCIHYSPEHDWKTPLTKALGH